MSAEVDRLLAARQDRSWRKWGPYLSERQWGTVREDYSENGDAWNSFTHDHARSRAYRWGEDGLLGVCDDKQRLCFALALWNGRDPILKERLFGLTNGEGNHGEDVKEYYYYLESTPTHSYMKALYKYPQAEFPYRRLLEGNRRRSRLELEYELLDTGVFDEDRYFDVIVEYAKAGPHDLLIRITAHNRGPEPARLHLLPTLWFRNTWAWGREPYRPQLAAGRESTEAKTTVIARHQKLGDYMLAADGRAHLLFTENDTNTERLFGAPNPTPFVKDAFHRYLVEGRKDAVHPEPLGTKAAMHAESEIPSGSSWALRLRLSRMDVTLEEPFGDDFERVFADRVRECDDFYRSITPPSVDADAAMILRQALAGMLWSKQYYHYDLDLWLEERGADPLKPLRRPVPRNDHWYHMYNADVISMPDKWEYPWYAAWDLAFHVLALSMVDEDFAKDQLELMLRERYMHPNGQIPAYEWNFGDVNPPVHAWATIFMYQFLRGEAREEDLDWLRHSFGKLLLNFTWWVNRKDRNGRNVFEGGFLGLDNIGVFDRSAPLPTGGWLEQADGTAWMALFSQNMLHIAIELARHDRAYQELALKFVQHFLWIASAMVNLGGGGMWDEEDGFFYDVLRTSDGGSSRLKVRSMVGLLPFCAVTVFRPEDLAAVEEVGERYRRFLEARPELVVSIHDPRIPGHADTRMLSVVDESRLRRILAVLLDEAEFFSPFGIRSLSRRHAEHPFIFRAGGNEYRVDYSPAESTTGMFGGNSNWRGPIWMPVNALLVRALLHYHAYFGDEFTVECPTGSGRTMTLFEVARELTERLAGIFRKGADGRRPVFGGAEKFQTDPHWRDHLLFYEYFHGDNGAGLGASHQTGWTGVIARLIQLFGALTPEDARMGRFGARLSEFRPIPAASAAASRS